MIKRFVGNVLSKFKTLNHLKGNSQRLVSYHVQKRPLTSFLVTLMIFFIILLLGKFLSPTPEQITQPEVVKEVQVLSVGENPSLKVQGKVEKSGVITIGAQAPGIVSKIHVKEGEKVSKGKRLISLASNYSGGNTASISRQIASNQYQNAKSNFDTQKEIIRIEKEIAEKNANNTEELRKISVASNEDAKSLLSLNEANLSVVDSSLNSLIQNNSGGANDQLIAQTRQSRVQLIAGINTLKAAIRSADYSGNIANSPTQLVTLNKDMTIKRLDLQEKALTLSLEISKLQLNLAAISESAMFPTSPEAGTIQKIHVKFGSQVNPGNPLVTIYAPNGGVTIVTKVPANIAKKISRLSPSRLEIAGQEHWAVPEFISSESTDGNLYQVIFELPSELHTELTNGSFIKIDLSSEGQSISGAFPYVPLDSVFQTQDTAYIYVADGDKAASRDVVLGEVIGSNVEIREGLRGGDQVILNRNVLSGDKIQINK